jgi:hypothetical protein
MTQFLLRLPDDIKEAFFQRQIEILQKGERLEKGKILIDWIRKGQEYERMVESKKAHPNDRS